MISHRWDLGRDLIDYHEAWQRQRDLHHAVVAGGQDTVLLLEHSSVYTAGRRTASWDRPSDGTPVVDVDRGGRITWHGPGQLIVYPIVRLAEPVDVVAYVRALEEAVINTCALWDIHAERVEGRSGAWVPSRNGEQDRKIAAIGVRVAQGVTMHGVAINVCPQLQAFSAIVPCGIADAGVTSVSELTGRQVSVIDCADAFEPQLQQALEPLLAGSASSQAALSVSSAPPQVAARVPAMPGSRPPAAGAPVAP